MQKDSNLLQYLIIFLLGLLIASNAFLFYDKHNTQKDLDTYNQDVKNLQEEINKLKADDIALAQAFNDLIKKLEQARVLPSGN